MTKCFPGIVDGSFYSSCFRVNSVFLQRLCPGECRGHRSLRVNAGAVCQPPLPSSVIGTWIPGTFLSKQGPFQLCPCGVAHLPPFPSPRRAPARPPGPAGRLCPCCQIRGCHDARRTALAGSKVKGTWDALTHSPDLPSGPSRLGDEAEREP